MNIKELRQAYNEGMITKEEFAERFLRLEEKPRVFQSKRIYEAISESDYIKLIRALPRMKDGKLKKTSMPYLVCFMMAYGSGLRLAEILALQPKDIDLEGRKIFVRQGKGSKDRVVNTPKSLKEAHIAYFPLKIGKRAVEKMFHKVSIKAGINEVLYKDKMGRDRMKYFVHSLRHSYSVRALEKGVPINHLQLLLGHSNIATTSKYTRANPVDAIQSIIDNEV